MSATPKLKILHVSTAHSWRGGENQIFLLAKGLAREGQQNLIVAPRGAPLLERAKESGLETQALSVRGPLGAWRLARLIGKFKPQVLHLHDGHAVMPGQLAGRLFPRERLAVVAHRRTVFKLRGRWKYRGRVDTVIAISRAVKENLRTAGIAEDLIRVVFSGLEFPPALPQSGPEAANLRRSLNIAPEAFLVAHAAALTSEKRQTDLIAALARIQAQEGSKVRPGGGVQLVIAGTGALESDLKAQIEASKLRGRVHLLGFRKDLRALWAAANAAVFASEAEGLCTALVEAQGAGLPAVVTNAGGMPEVVEEGVTGLVVPIGGVEALAAGLQKLAGDADLCARFGAAAAMRARALFSAEALSSGTLSLYRELCASKTVVSGHA